ncbi:MAG: PEP-CTERM sorting domain-containing protein [Opitutales bacterium]
MTLPRFCLLTLGAGLGLLAVGQAQTTSTWAGPGPDASDSSNWVSGTGPQDNFSNNFVFPDTVPANQRTVAFETQFGIAVGPSITIGDGYTFPESSNGTGWLLPGTGGTLEFSGSSTFNHNIRVNGGGTATLRQTNAGTLDLSSGNLEWGGRERVDRFVFEAADPSAQIQFSSGNGEGFRTKFQQTFTGSGTTSLLSGATLLAPDFPEVQNGVRIDGGNLVVDGIIQQHSNPAVVSVYNGGRLMGNGLVSSDGSAFIGRYNGTDTAGTLAPGSASGSIDTLTFEQDVTFSSTGVFEVDLGSGGTSDLLDLTGFDLILDTGSTLALSGTLETGQTYTLARFASIGGTASQFTTVTLNGDPFTEGTLDYSGSELALITAPIPEPATVGALFGLLGLAFAIRRKRSVTV